MPTLHALPRPRAWAPARPLRWGVIAPGGIASRFVAAVRDHTDQRVVAVGSRSVERARAFADSHGVPRAHGSYADVVADPEVDAVYVASPHSAHLEQALLAIAAGRHVLVEKPLATTGADARAIADAARHAGVLAMEAMWTRYLPQSDIIRQLLADGTLGTVTTVTADFGFSFPFDPTHRLYDPLQAGGTLLDSGVYPVSFVSSVLGAPGRLQAIGSLAPSGVDEQALVSFDYDGAVGTALSSLTSALPVRAAIGGTNGRIEVDSMFIMPSGLQVVLDAVQGQSPTRLEWTDTTFDSPYDALSCEAEAFAAFVEQGLDESPIHPLDEVVAIIDALDRARREITAAATR